MRKRRDGHAMPHFGMPAKQLAADMLETREMLPRRRNDARQQRYRARATRFISFSCHERLPILRQEMVPPTALRGRARLARIEMRSGRQRPAFFSCRF